MTDQYVKLTHGYFPDYCDQRIRGVSTLGDKFDVFTPNIVSNPLTWSDQLIGFKNPNWKEAVKNGTNATTVMDATKVEVKAERCQVSVITQDVGGYAGNYREFRWDGYPYIGGIPTLTGPSVAVLSSARNLALRKFLERVNEVRTSVEGGQALGEWKETVNAITNPLGALRKFTVNHVINAKKRLRRIHGQRKSPKGNRRGRDQSRSAGFAEALSGTYLEFVFGWIPLVKDINAGIIGLLDRYDQPDRKVVSAKAIVEYSDTSDTSVLFSDNFISAVQNRVNVSSVNYRFRACVQTGAVNGVRSVAATLGLLPERFIPTIWELIPYSFVVDYFVNVGDIIASYAFQRSVLSWGHRTIKIRTERKLGPVHCRFDTPPFPGYYPSVRRLIKMGATGGGANIASSSISRVPIEHDSLMPDLDIHLPFSAKAWTNIGALITQKFVSLF